MSARILLIGGLCLAGLGLVGIVVFTFGDTGITYTVVNRTSQRLVTWRLDHDCSVLVGHKGDYGPAKAILPQQTVLHSYVTGGSSSGCIQVATEQRRLVKVQTYSDGAVVMVNEPLTFLTEPVPSESELPRESYLGLGEEPWALTVAGIAYVAGILVALIGGLGMAMRYLRRRHEVAS